MNRQLTSGECVMCGSAVPFDRWVRDDDPEAPDMIRLVDPNAFMGMVKADDGAIKVIFTCGDACTEALLTATRREA
jgi:hypothetical protein